MIKVKELYLPIEDAAKAAQCTVRALLQRGAEGTIPIYVQLGPIAYTDIYVSNREPNGGMSELVKGTVSDITQEFYPTARGQFRLTPRCVENHLQSPKTAELEIEHYVFDEEGQLIKYWRLTNFLLERILVQPLLVMTDDLKKTGLLPDDTNTSLLKFIDDPRWPDELQLAITVWEEACIKFGPPDRPKVFMMEWLESKHPELSKDQIERIAMIANWNKKSGRPAR